MGFKSISAVSLHTMKFHSRDAFKLCKWTDLFITVCCCSGSLMGSNRIDESTVIFGIYFRGLSWWRWYWFTWTFHSSFFVFWRAENSQEGNKMSDRGKTIPNLCRK